MTKNRLHKELELLSLSVYEGNDKYVPKGWVKRTFLASASAL